MPQIGRLLWAPDDTGSGEVHKIAAVRPATAEAAMYGDDTLWVFPGGVWRATSAPRARYAPKYSFVLTWITHPAWPTRREFEGRYPPPEAGAQVRRGAARPPGRMCQEKKSSPTSLESGPLHTAVSSGSMAATSSAVSAKSKMSLYGPHIDRNDEGAIRPARFRSRPTRSGGCGNPGICRRSDGCNSAGVAQLGRVSRTLLTKVGKGLVIEH
jgi:hypothetical protein